MLKQNVGTFKSGKVIKVWDDGNAYRIEIQNQDKTNVWDLLILMVMFVNLVDPSTKINIKHKYSSYNPVYTSHQVICQSLFNMLS